MGVVMLTQGVRQIPIQYAKKMMGNKVAGGMMNNARSFIPLKINAAGVMPIIFAQAIMFIPINIALYLPDSDFWSATGSIFSPGNFWYNLVFVLLIVVFTYVYTAIAVNPNDIAEQLKKNGGFIPGVKQGKKTSEFIDQVLTRITLPGAIFLAIVAILPAIVTNFGVSNQFAQFFGGTSLLIMIGVVLDTLQQIESYLHMRHREGPSKSGRIKGQGTQTRVNI